MNENDLLDEIRARLIPLDDCLIWTGKFAHGSPVLRLNGKQLSIKRTWLNAHGVKGMLKPNCGNPACLNPSHQVHNTVPRGGQSLAVEPATPKKRILVAKHRLHEWNALQATYN